MSRRQDDLSTADLAGGGAEKTPEEPRDERPYDEEQVERQTTDTEEIREREVLRERPQSAEGAGSSAPTGARVPASESDRLDSPSETETPRPAESAEPATRPPDEMREPAGEGAPDASDAGDGSPRLMGAEDSRHFNDRWMEVQTRFVDEPRQAVQEADSLVAELMQRLAEGFAEERAGLERQWEREDEVSTEDLRVALRRYRTFFNRLLEA